jgi:hypothetical protein
MTNDIMNLRAVAEKTPNAVLREMIGFAAQRLMELEVESLTDASYGEKSPERLVQRNGYRDRDWKARASTVELRILWSWRWLAYVKPQLMVSRSLWSVPEMGTVCGKAASTGLVQRG